MVRGLLLGQWHSLSDRELERALTVRLDFMLFCGLSLIERSPGHTTICQFRWMLGLCGLDAALLSEAGIQSGIMFRASRGHPLSWHRRRLQPGGDAAAVDRGADLRHPEASLQGGAVPVHGAVAGSHPLFFCPPSVGRHARSSCRRDGASPAT